ncbi:hypothetical protein ABZ801_04810 [Actinomadura sp. NPDC047616]|uniref:hypothetical protein n=1 Tax=Actinomadura sp. NPDC047616 TaxID=3155914 RepID=UPI0033C54C6E
MPPQTHLDNLAAVLTRAGWSTRTRYSEAQPMLHVFAAAAPQIGECISVAPGPPTGRAWYRSSRGVLLTPCSDPMTAARKIAALLTPYVKAALPSSPRESEGNVPCWWGHHTRRWRGLIGKGRSARLISAETLEELAKIIAQTNNQR